MVVMATALAPRQPCASCPIGFTVLKVGVSLCGLGWSPRPPYCFTPLRS